MGGGHTHHSSGGEERPKVRSPLPNDENLREILTLKKELNLTDDQIEAIKAIRSDLLRETKTTFETMMGPQKELTDMLNKADPDFTGAKERIKEITVLMVKIQTLPIDSLEKAFKVLSGEQRTRLSELKKQALEHQKTEQEEAGGNPPSAGNETPH